MFIWKSPSLENSKKGSEFLSAQTYRIKHEEPSRYVSAELFSLIITINHLLSGTYSSDGLSVGCELCPEGYYTFEDGATSAEDCSGIRSKIFFTSQKFVYFWSVYYRA